MAPGASSTNDAIREFYAPRATESPEIPQQQPMPRVQHQTRQRPIELHTMHRSGNRTKPDDDNQKEAGCWGEIKNYKAGDEFHLLWNKPHNINRSVPSSRGTRQAPRPSSEAVRRQATDREDMHQPRQKGREKTPRNRTTEPGDEATPGRSDYRREPPQTNPSPPEQENPEDPHPGTGRKPKPTYAKKRGEVKQHTVKIAQLPPIHNSVHLHHTPSNNYRANPSPARGQKDGSNRNTRFSDFLHQERNVPPSQEPASSRETQWTYAVPGEGDEQVRNSRFSSVLDPAKAIKKAKETEKAKGPKCYISCQKRENMAPVQCSVCGQPNSPNTGYNAANGLWMCSVCRCPTTPKELPPSPNFDAPRPKASRPPIPQGMDKPKSKTNENFILGQSASHASLVSQSVPIEEYNSDHLYSDDSYETRATTPPPQKPIGLGITFHDSEEEEEEEEEEEVFRPTPPLKDSKYYQESPILQPMDYNQSHLHRPGAKHPYAPSPAQQRPPRTQPFNPTTYPYPSPPGSSTSLHRPRPASSVYPTDEPTADFPYPPPPIPLKFAKRSQRSSSVSPGTLSKAALARTEPGSPRSQSSPVGAEGGRNRRSSWYDFWKPVFDPAGEKSP